MNVLFINDFPFPNAGGVGKVTETLAAEFIRQGINVQYLALREGQDVIYNGVIQYFAPDNYIYSKSNISFLSEFIKTNKSDIIINQGGSKQDVLKVIVEANQGRAKLISVHHGCLKCHQDNYEHIIRANYENSKFYFAIANPISLFLLKKISKIKRGIHFAKAIRLSDKFVLLSELYIPELKIFLRHFDKSKVTGISNPLPFKREADSEMIKENRLIFVGRINFSEKRADLLIDLWQKLQHEFAGWTFDIIGDGPQLPEMKKRAIHYGLDRFIFHGYRDPRPFLEKGKIFCMTSAIEGYGMVLIEAQAYGVVPIAFNISAAINEIITDKVDGIIVPPFRIDLYIEYLRDLMNSDEKQKRMALNAQKSVEKFYVETIANKWKALFDELLH